MRPGRRTGQLRRENEDQEASSGVHATQSRQAAKKRKPKMTRRLLDGRKKAQKAQESDHHMAQRGFDSFGPAGKHAAFDLLKRTCFVFFGPLVVYSHAE